MTTGDQGTLVLSTDGHDLRLVPFTGKPMNFQAQDGMVIRKN